MITRKVLFLKGMKELIYSFSTTARDGYDGFTNQYIVHETKIIEDSELLTSFNKNKYLGVTVREYIYDKLLIHDI